VATGATTGSVRPRVYRLFQYVAGDGTTMARVLAESWGLRGKPWVLAIARTTWEFRKATINILMVLVESLKRNALFLGNRRKKPMFPEGVLFQVRLIFRL